MHASVELKNVSLIYDLYYDRTGTFKEYVINLVTRRKYVEKRKDVLHALNDVSVQVAEGDRLGIIGLNGSGKSTMLKVIAGILKPSKGELVVHGTVQPLIEIGAGFDPEFTGRENIFLNGYLLGFTKKQIQAKEQEIIDFADIGRFIDTQVKYYSSGMAVRLAFTIATLIEPEILVFDEMLSAGDAAFMQKAKQRINSLIDVAKMIILVSHDLALVGSLCNRVVVLDHGRKVFDGSTPEGLVEYQRIVDAVVTPPPA